MRKRSDSITKLNRRFYRGVRLLSSPKHSDGIHQQNECWPGLSYNPANALGYVVLKKGIVKS